MICIDTGVWLDHLTGGDRTAGCEAVFDDSELILLSPVILHEVAVHILKTDGPDVLETVLAHLRRCQIVPLDDDLARRGADLALQHHLNTVAALIAATAQAAGATLLTFDEPLLSLPFAEAPTPGKRK